MPEPVVPFDLNLSLPETPADWGKTVTLTFSLDPVQGIWEGQGSITLTAPPTEWVQQVPFRFSIPVDPISLALEGINIPEGATSLNVELTGFEWNAMPDANLKLLSKTHPGGAPFA